jgi:pilus assembly protein CpaB
MNKQRGWLLLSLGVLLAVGTGVAVFYLLRQQQQAALADARAIAEAQVAPVATLQLAGANAARVSSQLPAGQVIYAFPINDLLTQLSVVEPGDRIDLLITLPIASADASSAVQVTAFTVQNILVFDVVRPIVAEDEEGAPVALLLSLSPEDAALVKHVRDSEASIDFVLRSVLDTEPFEVTPIDREDLIARYGLR